MSTRYPAITSQCTQPECEADLQEPFTVAVPVSDDLTLQCNLLSSPCLRDVRDWQFLPQANFSSAARAYNHAIGESSNDLIIFAHQDVIFPRSWLRELRKAISQLKVTDPDWGVLGCWGATKYGSCLGHIYSTGLGILGKPFDSPQVVQTLDEIVLVIKKSSGLRFTEALPGFHFYGADICLKALKQGRKSYAISAFCVHNTRQLVVLPRDFYHCYRRFSRIWERDLPVATTCIRVSRTGIHLHVREMRDLRLRLLNRHTLGQRRVDDPSHLLASLNLEYNYDS